jgi:hypothetical protein
MEKNGIWRRAARTKEICGVLGRARFITSTYSIYCLSFSRDNTLSHLEQFRYSRPLLCCAVNMSGVNIIGKVLMDCRRRSRLASAMESPNPVTESGDSANWFRQEFEAQWVFCLIGNSSPTEWAVPYYRHSFFGLFFFPKR